VSYICHQIVIAQLLGSEAESHRTGISFVAGNQAAYRGKPQASNKVEGS
jgi:hypothetical protein